MAKKNKIEFSECMQSIPEILEWVDKQDVSGLQTFLLCNPTTPLICSASGGSTSSAIYASLLYSANKGIGKAISPLMFASLSYQTIAESKVLILTKSGNGFDVEYVAQKAVRHTPRLTACLTKYNSNKANNTVNIIRKWSNHWFMYNWESDENSFISTLSPFAMFGLLHKAYTNKTIIDNLNIDLNPEHCFKYETKIHTNEVKPFNEIKNYMVLYSGWSEPVAYDLESKMVESGYASVQLCDYRNFTHGRFIFLSNHIEDTVLVLLITPREKQFVNDLIYNGKTQRGGDELFPQNIQIVVIETDLDTPSASIDLLVKGSIFFSEVGKSYGYNPCDPINLSAIDKRTPRSMAFEGLLDIGNLKGVEGEIKLPDRKIVIDYNPELSIAENAQKNNVVEATIKKYIQEKRIDRKRDEQYIKYNKVKLAYTNDSERPVAKIAKKLGYSINTVKQYLNMDRFDIDVQEGKIGLVVEDERLKTLWKKIDSAKSQYERVKKLQEKHPKYTPDEIISKLNMNAKLLDRVQSFMQMDEFKYKLKKRELVFDIEPKENGKIMNMEMKNRIIGSIIGDVVGSTYEFVTKIPKKFKLFRSGCTFTDDTVLTIAIADALLHNRPFADTIWEWGSKYTNAGFGHSFKEWKKRRKTDINATNNSKGYGCGMRGSPVGYWAKSIKEAMELAKKPAIITQNSEEGIIGAQAIASATFMAKQKVTKDDIKKFIEDTFNYNLDMTYDEIWKQVNEYDNENKLRREREWAENTCPVAIIAFLNSSDYESAIRTAISYGGDVDTIACMTGGIAAAYYGVPDEIIEMAASYLPQDIIDIVNEFDGLELKNKNTPPQLDRWYKKEHILVYGSGQEIVSHTKSGSPIRDNESTGYIANRYFGSRQQLEGVSGCSYAIPTVGATLPDIQDGIKRFIDFVNDNPDLTFLITDIACSKKSGYTPQEVAPMFKDIADYPNVYLPKEFREVIS